MSHIEKQKQRFNVLLDTFFADSFTLEEAIDSVNCCMNHTITVLGRFKNYDSELGFYNGKSYVRNISERKIIDAQRLNDMVLIGWLSFDGYQYSIVDLEYR